MTKKQSWWMIIVAILMTVLLTGCFRGAPNVPLEPFLTLIAPYPGATGVRHQELTLWWEVEFRPEEEMLSTRDNPLIWYLIDFAKGEEAFGEPQLLQAGTNAFFRTNHVELDFETEYRWRITALFSDGHRIVSEEASFTTRRDGLESLPPLDTVLINRGTFQMGNTRDDREGDSREKPVHTVELTYDYEIGKYEVTFDEYDAYCDATGQFKPSDPVGRGDRPVVNVNWNNAVGYCNWLSRRHGLQPAYGQPGWDGWKLLNTAGEVTTDITEVEGYRLPTEAEWEYAARGGHKSTGDYKYAGSNNIDKVAWSKENSNGQAHEVGQKDPNELGLYDMSGNVWEMCHDYWDYNYYEKSPREDPIGPNSRSYNVLRGGGWGYDVAGACRVANRDFRPAPCYVDLGLRIARTRK